MCWCVLLQHACCTANKYSTRPVRTRYGELRGVVAARTPGTETQVEVFLGVPYATPPLGALRFMPPVTPSPWRGTRLADAPAPACPQRVPPSSDPGLPRVFRDYLDRLAPALANQSEDCLYLNLYVPRPPPNTVAAAAGPSSTSAGLFFSFFSFHFSFVSDESGVLPTIMVIFLRLC